MLQKSIRKSTSILNRFEKRRKYNFELAIENFLLIECNNYSASYIKYDEFLIL
jgi:hypothetical protein